MCIIKIWSTCTCSSAYKLVENQIFVLGCMLRSHARNGNEFQTPGHCWLPAKHWDTLFFNSSKSKTRLKFMKLGMLSCNGIRHAVVFLCPFWEKVHSNNNQQRHFETNSCHSNIANICIIQIVCIMFTIHVTPRVLVLMAIGFNGSWWQTF